MTKSTESKIWSLQCDGSSLPNLGNSNVKYYMTELALNKHETYVAGWKPGREEIYIFAISSGGATIGSIYYYNMGHDVVKLQFGDNEKEVYYFFEERIEYKANFFFGHP